MYLKNITLKGFKSFGNRSSLNFEPGISVVVGPNGSGKSNVADGISWVLGEQSPKSLRGSSMGDVIFRSKKQEMGIAEVSLLFNNKDRIFDVEFSEVKITRRVLTEGGSDYFINSSPCRLMDIQEMIADSGIGKGLHIIINQGQVNRVALLRPVERKLMIDEALGLSKHKDRRKKSIAKLEKVKGDIGRLNDLMEEIRRTMDPLEIEAKRAREYAVIANELKDEEISLFLTNLSGLNSSWATMEEDHKETKAGIKKTGDRILEVERGKGDLIKNIGSKQAEFESWRAKIESFDSGTRRLSNNMALIESKKNVFSTLYNMFDLELGSSESRGKAAGEIAENKEKEIMDLSFIGKITKKLEMIETQFKAYLNRVSEAVKGSSISKDIENEGDIIFGELTGILKEMQEGNIVRRGERSKEAARESKKLFEEEKKRSELRLKKIKDLKGLCRVSLDRAEGALNILKKHGPISEKIKKRLYPEFERQKRLISGDQQKIEKYNRDIGDLKIKENRLDNDIFKIDLRREQIREKVKSITAAIVDDYNMSIEYASKNFKPSEDLPQSEIKVRHLKSRMRNFGNVNPNAAIEFAKIKKRFDFLNIQRQDLTDGRKQLEGLIREINEKIGGVFLKKFEEINTSFQQYFKILFPRGEGEMILDRSENGSAGDEDLGVDLKVDIGNNKLVSLSLLSGGEKSLVSMAFLFSIFSINLSPFYVFDEADAALDDANIARFLSLVKKFSKKQQIIIITHQKKTMEIADTIYGVTMQSDGISKVVSEKIDKKNTADIKS
ncbi:MAG: AAA family ATPase [Actinomycetia bacterium]|nr:AAA family ATPase [Actinomycetes bacterium]